jgi:hypothetical protein
MSRIVIVILTYHGHKPMDRLNYAVTLRSGKMTVATVTLSDAGN